MILFCSTATVSLTLPDLSDLITLIGALASSSLALIIPPVLEILCYWRRRKHRTFLWVLPWPVWLSKDIFIMLVGIVALLLGVYTSCRQIRLNFFKKEEQNCTIFHS